MNENSAWDAFFGNPFIGSILEEAQLQQVDSDDDPVPEKEEAKEGQPQDSQNNLEQIQADFEQGNLSQDDLINLYKSGKLSKEDIEGIVNSIEGEGQEQVPGQEEPQSQEELLAQQIDQTNDMFVKFALYDKITELGEKLTYFQDNFNDMRTGLYDRVLQLKEFLNILSSLVFNLETSIAYQMYGSILLQLTELFDEYKQQEEKEKQEEAQEKVQEQQMENE